MQPSAKAEGVARTTCLARRWPQRERSTRPLASSMISQTVWRSQSAPSSRSSTSGSNDSWTSSPRSSRTLQRARRSRSGRDQRYGDGQLSADRSGVATGCWAGPPCSPSRRLHPRRSVLVVAQIVYRVSGRDGDRRVTKAFRNTDQGRQAASAFKRELSDSRTRYDVRTRIGGRVVTRTFASKKEADAYAATTTD